MMLTTVSWHAALLALMMISGAGLALTSPPQQLDVKPTQMSNAQQQLAETQYRRHTGQPGHVVKPVAPPLLCTGESCKRMSALLPQLRFKTDGQKITCTCEDFFRAACFAPGCFPCDKACLAGLPAEIAQQPGPLGTGLLCSMGCNPCCQKDNDKTKSPNSTCVLVGTTC